MYSLYLYITYYYMKYKCSSRWYKAVLSVSVSGATCPLGACSGCSERCTIALARRSMMNEPGQTAMHPESPASPAAAPPAAVLAVLSCSPEGEYGKPRRWTPKGAAWLGKGWC